MRADIWNNFFYKDFIMLKNILFSLQPMKINTPSPSLTRAIAKRLATQVASARRNKVKPIHKSLKNGQRTTQDASRESHTP